MKTDSGETLPVGNFLKTRMVTRHCYHSLFINHFKAKL